MGKDTIDLIYEVWTPMHYEVIKTTEKEYQDAFEEQLREIHELLAKGEIRHALMEMADIISLSVNWMRSQGLTPEGIKNVCKHRVETRYRGRTAEIIKKYRKMSGVE